MVTKPLLETQTPILNLLSNTASKPVSINLASDNCSIQTEKEDIENKVDRDKDKVKRPE